jgi:hypothetical protein
VQISIHQPQYWPWPPYLHKIISADLFVYLDTAQFSKNGLQNRNRIKTPNGAAWLTLPVKQQLGQCICDTVLADSRSLVKHYKSIAANYSKTPGFLRWKDELEHLLLENPEGSLADVAVRTTEWLLGKIGSETKRIRLSDFPEVEGRKDSLIVNICSRFSATTYLSGQGGLEYMDKKNFDRIDCRVRFQECGGLTYSQAFSHTGFVPDLSSLDLVLNCPDEAGKLIRCQCSWSEEW